MATVLRLLQGDKRNPTRVLDFTQAGGKIRLAAGGFSPAPGKQTVLWSGQTQRSDGQQRLDSSRDNAEFTLTYNLVEGGSAAELDWLQRQINRFFFEAGLYEEKREGEPVWLEYCWPDGLEDLPAPDIGQLRRYPRLLRGEPSWPRNLHTWIRAGAIEGIVANLVCGPVADGLKQAAGPGKGQLELGSNGVLIPEYVENECTNPSFGHGTWNNGWTPGSASLQANHEIRANFTHSLNSAAHLVNQSASAQKFTLTATTYQGTNIISCYVRRPDGEPVTSADMQMYAVTLALTTTFVPVDGGPWYRAYGSIALAEGSNALGVQVKPGREIIVDDFQFELAVNFTTPLPFCAGYKIGCSWTGTPHASESSRPSAALKWPLADELMGEYTVAGWLTPHWTNAGPSIDLCVWEYWVSATNYVRVYYDFTADRFEVIGSRDGTAFSGNGSGRTISIGDHMHVAVVQDTNTLKVYINGSEDISVNNALGMPAGGTFALGYSTQSNMPITAEVDGWRIWQQALSATQISQVCNNEKPIKDDHGIVGMPPFAWTKDGDGILDACDDTNRDNYMIMGGIGGDMVEAIAEWQIDPKTTTPPDVYWIGRKAVEEPFDPASTFWLEFQGTVDSGSSGGEYEPHTFAGVGTYDFAMSVDEIKHLQGRVHFLARLYVAGNAVDVNPFYKFGTGPRNDGEVHTIPTNANFLLRAYPDWDMWIRWDHLREGETPASLTLGLHVSDPTGGATVRCDFIQVLPYPNARIEIGSGISLAAGDTLHVIQDEAYVLASSGAEKYSPEFRGEPVNLLPNKYNYVWFLPGEEGQPYDVTDYATFVVYVTPRWVLPGGPVA